MRDYVRSEYYHVLKPSDDNGFEGSYGTMYRDKRYKLVVYHNQGLGELLDLETDPDEFDNLWDNPDYRDLRFDLLLKSYNAQAHAVDIGSEQIMYS